MHSTKKSKRTYKTTKIDYYFPHAPNRRPSPIKCHHSIFTAGEASNTTPHQQNQQLMKIPNKKSILRSKTTDSSNP
jgi:hypothetical protein